MKQVLRAGTRGSQLALKQTQDVLTLVGQALDISFETVEVATQGDIDLKSSFQDMNAQSVFTKELDEALLAGRIDLAVHSMKDLASQDTRGVRLAFAGLEEDPRDVWISKEGCSLDGLAAGAKIGSSSIRRQMLIKENYPHLETTGFRGNLATRFDKLHRSDVSGMLLAAAGLKRLGWQDRIHSYLDPSVFVPAAGQGLVAVTIRQDDRGLFDTLQGLQDPWVWERAVLQRQFMAQMNGGCQVPMGFWIETHPGRECTFHAYISDTKGTQSVRHRVRTKQNYAAQDLSPFVSEFLDMGGKVIIESLRRP